MFGFFMRDYLNIHSELPLVLSFHLQGFLITLEFNTVSQQQIVQGRILSFQSFDLPGRSSHLRLGGSEALLGIPHSLLNAPTLLYRSIVKFNKLYSKALLCCSGVLRGAIQRSFPDVLLSVIKSL